MPFLIHPTTTHPFQGGLQANSGSEAAHASYTVVVLDSATSNATNESLSASNDLPAKPKHRKSNPRSWKAHKNYESQGRKYMIGICLISIIFWNNVG